MAKGYVNVAKTNSQEISHLQYAPPAIICREGKLKQYGSIGNLAPFILARPFFTLLGARLNHRLFMRKNLASKKTALIKRECILHQLPELFDQAYQ